MPELVPLKAEPEHLVRAILQKDNSTVERVFQPALPRDREESLPVHENA